MAKVVNLKALSDSTWIKAVTHIAIVSISICIVRDFKTSANMWQFSFLRTGELGV